MTGNFIPPVEGPWRGHNGLRTLSGRHYKALLFTDLWDVNGSGSQRQNGTHLALVSGVFGKVQSLREGYENAESYPRVSTDWRGDYHAVPCGDPGSEPHGVHKVCESQHLSGRPAHDPDRRVCLPIYTPKHSGCSLGHALWCGECASYGVSSREKE